MTSSNPSHPSHKALQLFLLQQEWAYEQAGQFFWKRHIDAALEHVILSLANVGFFPTRAWFRKCEERVRGQGSGGGVSKFLDPDLPIEGFEKRAYQIRTADLADLPALLALEEACWSDGLRAHADELVARITNILRRTSDEARSQLDVPRIQGLEVDTVRRLVKLDGEIVELTTMEYELLLLFMQSHNKTFTRDELMNRLRGIDAELFSRAVDTLVSRLRHKLKDTSKTPRFIKTVWGRGYTFVGEPG